MNPFSKGRYEHIPTHLYYLPHKLISELEDSTPSYVIGSRGSGKTTLLKSLNWEERIRNKWLNQELGGDAFRGRFIGVYTKLPLIQVRSFKAWLREHVGATSDSLFGYYVDLVSIENLAFSLSVIVNEMHIDVSPENESVAVSRFLHDSDYLIENEGDETNTLVGVHQAIRQRRRRLEKLAQAGISPSTCLADFFIPEIGELSRSFCSIFGALLDASTETEELQKWHFKFCFDEAECLDDRQLLVINTIIRTTESPASYVISFVGQPTDLSRTLHDNLTAQSADRFIHFLDHITRPEFENLCDGIANVRIRAQLESEGRLPGDLRQFQTANVLGRLNLNLLVHELVSKSESGEAKALEKLAERFRISPWLQDGESLSVPPYIEAHLADVLKLTPPPGNESNAKRRQASQEFRKKFVASYLSICRELKVRKIPYAFANMVIGISDSCVRDYLSQMHQIFESFEGGLVDFVNGTVDWQLQSDAIHIASDNKKRSISSGIEVSKPENVRRLTYCLGALAAVLQQGTKGTVIHLRSSERGIFQFSEPIGPEDKNPLLFDVLKDANEAGFIRVKSEGQRILGFRVHASMAPSFGFSYRGAYYPVVIKKGDVIKMLETPDDDDLILLAKQIGKRISEPGSDSAQMTLWPTDDASGFVFDDSDVL
ncbi:hypothetical protein SAMN06265222_1334 [Neorhodopirellula lusitana]|uniref:ATP-binding protein n=1 Tax=Neorhodopirellula lusitana TaxID=445327 RepID=A0ABY1QV11_9BACT|nr:hypothetical protein [Neorhodopirellula lusitana]SMP79537.1 hypothetical protein SAMN06265222_1334 [Neorhodopirellula lusitana]